jgi:hypothetical protein
MGSGYSRHFHLKSLMLRDSVQLTRHPQTCSRALLLTRYVLKRILLKPFLQQLAARIA